MQPGEVVVARLGKGPAVVRFLGANASRVTVALDRRREARIPSERVVLSTGLVVPGEDEVENLRLQCDALSSYIDLSDVWEVLLSEATPVSLESLSELYWGPSHDVARRIALLVHLEQNSDYFQHEEDGYVARPRESVEEIQARRRREAEKARAAESLMHSLSLGSIPEQMTGTERVFLEHLRSYAINGEKSVWSTSVRGLLEGLLDTNRDLQRACFDLLVAAGVFTPDEPLELHRSGISSGFPEEVLAEAGAVQLAEHLQDPRRRDLTALPTITIDNAETEDRDDALSVEMPESDSSMADGFRIGIHIADAGSLISYGGAIEQEADRRMATLYLPDGNIGMLPQGFIGRVGSLDPGKTRLAMSLVAHVDPSGDILEWEVTPSVVRSQAALTYQGADRALKDRADRWHSMLTHLERVALAGRRKRESAGAVNLDQPEMSIKVKPSGEVDVRVVQRFSPSRTLVAELMIICNSLLAEFCRKEVLPAVFRSQASPDLDGLAAYSQPGVHQHVGQVVPNNVGDASRPPGVIEELVKSTLGRYLITKRLTPAELDTIPAPHGALGVPTYIQATSPLRRYPDLVMQRQISHFLGSGQPLYSVEIVASVLHRAEVQLRDLARLEDGRKRYWFLKYLQQSHLDGMDSREHVEFFAAVVLENETRRPALLELAEFPFRTRATLPRPYVPGDTVTLKLDGVDLWRRVGHFVYVPNGA